MQISICVYILQTFSEYDALQAETSILFSRVSKQERNTGKSCKFKTYSRAFHFLSL